MTPQRNGTPTQQVQVVAEIKIGLLPNGTVIGQWNGVQNRQMFNMMLETFKQDALRKFAESETASKGGIELPPPGIFG